MRNFMMLSITLILTMLFAFNLSAQPPEQANSYVLVSSVISNGGNTATGGGYTMQGTIGQANVGPASGGSYTISSGFWSPKPKTIFVIYLPLIAH